MRLTLNKLAKFSHPEYDALTDRLCQRVPREYRLKRVVQQRIPLGPGLWIACDQEGDPVTTEIIHQCILEWRMKATDVAIVVGGPYGFDPETINHCTQRWSLAPGLLSSDLAFLVLCEQIYRATSIIAGSKYHHS